MEQAQEQAEPIVEAEAMTPKPGSDGASSSCEPQQRPTSCPPDAVLGEWRTRFGVYTIALNDQMELDFHENNLHGILRLEDGWYTAEIHDSAQADMVFGYLRLQREGDVIKSHFKAKAEVPWERTAVIVGKPLPYLRVGAAAAAEAAAEAEAAGARPWEQTTCCICFEALDGGEDFAELRCHHMYHKSCIRSWFVRNGSCPMRCAHA